MKDEIKKDNLYINIDLFIKEFYLNKKEIYDTIYNTVDGFTIMNRLIYNNNIYINIKCFIYILYNIDQTDLIRSTITYFIQNITNLQSINKRIIKQLLTIDKLPFLTNSLLLFDNQNLAGYVYCIKNSNNLKIGITNNPINRLRNLQTIEEEYQKIDNNNNILVLLLYFSNITIARRIESNIKVKYNSFNIKGEWFTFNECIINSIKDDYIDNIVI
jgi:predicted GIY-YIG superfamily endonuclease